MEGLCECGCGRPTQVAKKTDRKKGYEAGKPRRFVRGHQGALAQTHRVSDEGYRTPCHLWLGGVSGPYGWARATSSRRATFAHIAALLDAGHAIPDGHAVHHLCGVKMCVNVDHLVVASHADHRRLHPEARRPSRLTPEQIAYVRSTDDSLRVIGKKLGIHYTYAARVRRGELLA